MGFGRTELCMLTVIVGSALYLYLGKEDEQNSPILRLSEDDIPADPPDYDPAAEQSVRMCKSNGHALNAFVLDLTYSLFPDERIGDDILQDLFDVRKSHAIESCSYLCLFFSVLQLQKLGSRLLPVDVGNK